MIAALWIIALACARPPSGTHLVEQLDREVIALRTHNQSLRAQLGSCADGNIEQSLYPLMVQIFADTEVTVRASGARVALTVRVAMLFSSDGISLRDEAEMVLDLLSTTLTQNTDTHIQVIGHTHDRALSGSLKQSYRSLWGISTARSEALMHAMVDRYELASGRFTISGQGDSEPVVSNDTPSGRARNARMVIILGPRDSWD